MIDFLVGSYTATFQLSNYPPVYGPMSRIHRTANKRVRSFAVGHDIHPFFDVGKILINWISTMKKNQVAKIRKLSPILLKTFKNLDLKSSRRANKG